MSGRRLGSFRQGDRSEYLAMFGLSRFAFVHPVPRQEDFGVVDFLCVLTKAEGSSIYPESAFYVQIKSSKSDLKPWDAGAIRWISKHMDHPLLLCFSDKARGELTFYSCSRIWFALFLRSEPDEIVPVLDSDGPPDGHYELEESDGRTAFRVHLGQPILSMRLDQLEAEADLAYQVMEPWIRTDAANIARRRLGRIAVVSIGEWKTNDVPGAKTDVRYYHGPDFGIAERELRPMLGALVHNYQRANAKRKLEALRRFLEALSE